MVIIPPFVQMQTVFEMELPIVTVSEANLREHWSKSAKRHKLQKAQVWVALNNYFNDFHRRKFNPRPFIPLPCTVTLTRISPRKLDQQDNLPTSMKYIVDSIADFIRPGMAVGRADDTKEIQWVYEQSKGAPKYKGIRIKIEA